MMFVDDAIKLTYAIFYWKWVQDCTPAKQNEYLRSAMLFGLWCSLSWVTVTMSKGD